MSTASKAVSARLPDIVGAGHVLTDTAQLDDYSVDGKLPTAVVRPGSNDEIVEIIKYAVAEKIGVIACGARTKLGMGLPPRQYDLAIDMTRLDRVISYDPGDLTLSVEAGAPLKQLAATLGEHRQFLPLAVPYFDRTTVGGTIASGVDSPLRQYYGTARDYVLGMEFLTGEGAYSKSGGRVVKNVTGYDLHKLMIGALGSLGIITRINFKTFPLPLASRGFVARFGKSDQAIGMRHRVAQSSLAPMTFEILSPRVADIFDGSAAQRIVGSPMPPGVISPKHWMLAIGYAGNENVLARYETDLRRMALESGADEVSVLGDDVRPSAFAHTREFIPIALESSPATTVVKIGVLPTRLKDALDAAAKVADANEVPWAAVVRGLGVIYFALLPKDRSEEARQTVTVVTDRILDASAALQANATIPWCPSEWKSWLKIWGHERSDRAQMQKVKKVFDPHGIFSPGRFIGGL